jgi:circadian clock protein KaiC
MSAVDHNSTAAATAAGTQFPRVLTGNPQVDEVLGGGFPANSINIVMGQPGTGKTVFAEQMLFHNAVGDRPMLYVTTLSEPMTKVISYVQRFQFFDVTQLGTRIQYEDVGSLLGKAGPGALLTWLQEAIKTLSPRMIVIDSFRALHDLASSTQEMRRLISDMAGLLSAYEVTTFLLGEYTGDDVDRYPEFAVADAIVELARHPLTSHDERFFRVLKLRGSGYREGQHAFRISDAGIELFPRLVSPQMPEDYVPRVSRISSGVEGLDAMFDGGLWSGTTTLVAGPTGSGKTTIGLQFALEGIRLGEEVLFVNFQENPAQLRRTLAGLGTDAVEARKKGLHLMYSSPVELQIDSIIVQIFELVRGGTIRRVVIDAVGDLAYAAADAQRLHDYLYSLTQHLTVKGITTILTFESGVGHTGNSQVEARFSYLSDNVILLALGGGGDVRRTIRVVKARNSAHDHRARSFEIDKRGGRAL